MVSGDVVFIQLQTAHSLIQVSSKHKGVAFSQFFVFKSLIIEFKKKKKTEISSL